MFKTEGKQGEEGDTKGDEEEEQKDKNGNKAFELGEGWKGGRMVKKEKNRKARYAVCR